MIKTKAGIGVALAAAVLVAAAVSERGLGRRVEAQATQMPVFQMDTAWPQKLPYNWIVGHVPSVAVDSRDHLFMLTRPNTLPPEDRARAAPPVIEFDVRGPPDRDAAEGGPVDLVGPEPADGPIVCDSQIHRAASHSDCPPRSRIRASGLSC